MGIPLIIGISGPTTSGKSTISESIANDLHCPILCTDDYFKVNPEMPKTYFGDIEVINFDKVESIDWNMLIEDIKTRYENEKYLILEGFILFGHPDIQDYVKMLIKIDYNDDDMEIALNRRLTRNGYKNIEDCESNPYETREKFCNFYFRKIAWPQRKENAKFLIPSNWKKPVLELSAIDNLEANIEKSRQFVSQNLPSNCLII